MGSVLFVATNIIRFVLLALLTIALIGIQFFGNIVLFMRPFPECFLQIWFRIPRLQNYSGLIQLDSEWNQTLLIHFET